MKACLLTNAFELELTSFKDFTENLCSSAMNMAKKSQAVLVPFKVQRIDLASINYFLVKPEISLYV